VTIPGRTVGYMLPSAMKRRRYRIGSGEEYRTLMTLSEFLQLAGRLARESPHEATLYVEGAT
jgi:hypothetical protein